MKIWKLISLMCLLFLMNTLHAKDSTGAMALNGDMAIKFADSQYEGRVSAAFSPTVEGLHKGELGVDQFNLVIFGVPQSTITGREAIGNESGALGFSLSGKESSLSYNPRSQMIEGSLHGFVNIPGYVDPKPKQIGDSKDDEGDAFAATTQEAVLHIAFSTKEELQNLIGLDKQMSFDGEMKLMLEVKADDDLQIKPYELQAELIPVVIDWGWYLETARNLCVQPVRIGRFSFTGGWPPVFNQEYTGTGLPFGKPGAITEWKKADVTLTWREWQTVWNSSYWDFSESEHTALRATVDVDDCVEVFFIDNMQPSVFWGGGASFNSGTASAKVISNDENADFGVDLTHLAHELGHVVSLCHPGSSSCESRPEMNPSSSGTLMCGSGFNNDNPAVNSTENENNVNNPLITFSLKFISAGPDCTNSATCGACP